MPIKQADLENGFCKALKRVTFQVCLLLIGS